MFFGKKAIKKNILLFVSPALDLCLARMVLYSGKNLIDNL